MQARALFEAVADATKKGIKCKPENYDSIGRLQKGIDMQVAIVHEVAQLVQTERK